MLAQMKSENRPFDLVHASPTPPLYVVRLPEGIDRSALDDWRHRRWRGKPDSWSISRGHHRMCAIWSIGDLGRKAAAVAAVIQPEGDKPMISDPVSWRKPSVSGN